jgi:hypothetical protein
MHGEKSTGKGIIGSHFFERGSTQMKRITEDKNEDRNFPTELHESIHF